MGSSTPAGAAPISAGRWLLLYTAGVVLVLLIPLTAYFILDPERHELDESARSSAPGRFARLSDGVTHYELAGPATSEVVVLAAGTSVPYYIWDPTFAALVKDGYRVLRYDYYGRGYSDRPAIAYTQDLYVRQLIELLNALEIRTPVHLAGLSFGGSVITSVADRHPDRVRSLVYVDPAFRMPVSLTPVETMPRVWSFMTGLMDERAWADEQLGDFLHPDRFPDWPERYRLQLRYRGFRQARLSDLVANADIDQHDELERVGQADRPVLVVWGREDQNVPFQLSDALMQAMPRARLVPIDDAGHLPHWEQSGAVDEAVLGFLKEIG